MTTEAPVWPAELFEDLDRNGPIPLYFQVAQRLESGIRSGILEPGARLENEIAVAKHLNVSRPTVRRAIQEVVDKGLLVRRRGVGTQVVQSHVTRPVELTSFFNDLKNANLNPQTKVLEHRILAANSSIAEKLGVSPGDEILLIRRLRLTGDIPVAILENYLPTSFVDITLKELEAGGLYDALRARGVVLKIANQKIGARRVVGDESKLLDVDEGGPLLTVERVALDNAGQVIEVGNHCYRPDMYTFETTLVAR
ncbi:GntR family transcriptional regulator [Corynebacterium callunae]|uniref:GntR family transcriptional regulator n=1 Tax=Corynebacterium callunae TaxID=1721 RepID=UPI00200056C2|nr:GntR family transcriptional regulator [Corynebacterium callunae]MCK2199579.1 GntR family transcriptional regulator [Corynebacterium callunae]